MRPPFNARSSSLSVASRGSLSTSSLPGTARAVNGSTLKQELSAPLSAEDPLDALERIVGLPRPREDDAEGHDYTAERPQELEPRIEFKGLSLEDFVRKSGAHNHRSRAEIEQLSTQSVEECEYVVCEERTAHLEAELA